MERFGQTSFIAFQYGEVLIAYQEAITCVHSFDVQQVLFLLVRKAFNRSFERLLPSRCARQATREPPL